MFVVRLLFLGRRKEANHFHCLLQPLEVMAQVFLIFDLKVFLQRTWRKRRQGGRARIAVGNRTGEDMKLGQENGFKNAKKIHKNKRRNDHTGHLKQDVQTELYKININEASGKSGCDGTVPV